MTDQPTPRLPLQGPSDWNDEARAFMAPFVELGMAVNALRSFSNSPPAARAWWGFAQHLMQNSSLDPRQREIVILRAAVLSKSAYEWGHHVVMGRDAGLTDEEIRATREGEGAAVFGTLDKLVLRATDEAYRDGEISADTWASLATHYDPPQLMDLTFTIGHYRMLAFVLKSFGVPVDPGLPGFDF